ncbi:hypothetical protein BSL78_09327, partial [Apostichopus japonicus]
ELTDINKNPTSLYRINSDDTNILLWKGLIIPQQEPYNKGAFKIEINFPAEYPFKPPKITFKTKIYHPNIDEKGQVCLPIISPENWKPATKADQVIQALLALVHSPEPEHPLRGDLAEEYAKDKKKFFRNAEDYTKKFGEKRP